jgi:hypothetical protein
LTDRQWRSFGSTDRQGRSFRSTDW